MPSAIENDRSTSDGVDARSLTMAVRRVVAPPVQFVGFWAAISLPFLYLPLLSGGLDGAELTVFVGLLALNVVALFVGHGHRREE